LEVFVKKLIFFVSIILIILLAACGSASDDELQATPIDAQLDEPTAPDTAYPGPASPPAELLPMPTGTPGAYPLIDEPWSTPDPYPDGVAIIIHPAGEQCAETLIYPDLDSAVNILEDAGVTVVDSEQFEQVVCQACGCPTSQYYRLQIEPESLSKAMALGWVRGE
jgi:hypothetical protein